MRDLKKRLLRLLLAAETGPPGVLYVAHALDATETSSAHHCCVSSRRNKKQIRLRKTGGDYASGSGEPTISAPSRRSGAGCRPGEVMMATAYIRDCIINPDKHAADSRRDFMPAPASTACRLSTQSLYDLYYPRTDYLRRGADPRFEPGRLQVARAGYSPRRRRRSRRERGTGLHGGVRAVRAALVRREIFVPSPTSGSPKRSGFLANFRLPAPLD